MMHGPLVVLFIALSLGYFVCVAARKQMGILKTVGYTIGISMIVLSLLWGLATSVLMSSHPMGKGMHKMMGGYKGMQCSMMK